VYDNLSDTELLALCIWRESRGETYEAKFAVGCSIRNRVNDPSWWNDHQSSYRLTILKPWQYSSFNAGDPNSTKFPLASDKSYQDSLEAAQAVLAGVSDNTGGATCYFDRSLDSNPPKWVLTMIHTSDIGNLHFYALGTHRPDTASSVSATAS
jgi:N-acetylmuramoyl-L-alanine amidase